MTRIILSGSHLSRCETECGFFLSSSSFFCKLNQPHKTQDEFQGLLLLEGGIWRKSAASQPLFLLARTVSSPSCCSHGTRVGSASSCHSCWNELFSDLWPQSKPSALTIKCNPWWVLETFDSRQVVVVGTAGISALPRAGFQWWHLKVKCKIGGAFLPSQLNWAIWVFQFLEVKFLVPNMPE